MTLPNHPIAQTLNYSDETKIATTEQNKTATPREETGYSSCLLKRRTVPVETIHG